jgi:hypothetical protein
MPAAAERALLFKNAILVYELADFTIRYIEQFALQGIGDINILHREIKDRIERVRAGQHDLRQKASAPDIDPQQRDQIVARVDAREASLKEVETEWTKYLTQIGALQESTIGVKQLLPTLKLLRDDAKSQIEFLEILAMMQNLKSYLSLLETAVVKLGSIKIATLSVDQVQRLLGIGTEGRSLT